MESEIIGQNGIFSTQGRIEHFRYIILVQFACVM